MKKFNEYEYIDYTVKSIHDYVTENNLEEVMAVIVYTSGKEELDLLQLSPTFHINKFSKDDMDEFIGEIKIIDDCFLGKDIVVMDETNNNIICNFKIIR